MTISGGSKVSEGDADKSRERVFMRGRILVCVLELNNPITRPRYFLPGYNL